MRRCAGTRNGRCRRDTARRDVAPSWTVGLLLLSAATSPAWAGDGVFEALAITHVSGEVPAADFDLPTADGKGSLYPTAQTPFATVDIRYGLTRDLYVILAGFDREAQWATLKAQIHPMIAWLWIGGVVVLLGGLVALWPGGERVPARVPSAEAAGLAGASEGTS